ncbi:MAG: MFS transporter [Promethearchaeota archaeon]
MTTGQNFHRQILFGTTVGHFVYHVFQYVLPSLIIVVQDDIILTYSEYGILVTLPMIILIILSPAVGLYGKSRYGYILIPLGLIFYGISMLITSFANSFLTLLFGQIVLGIAGAQHHPIALGLISNYRENDRGRALSIHMALGLAGNAISPILLVGAAEILFGWRFTLQILVFFALISTILLWILLKDSSRIPPLSDKEEDPSPLTANTESSNFYQASEGMDKNGSHKPLITLIIAIFSLPVLLALGVAIFRGGVFRSLAVFTVTLLNNFFLFDKLQSGLFTSIILSIGASGSVLGGSLSDRGDSSFRVNVLIGTGIMSIITLGCVIILSFQNIETPVQILFLVGSYALWAFFFYAGGPIIQALLGDLVPSSYRSTIFGISFSIGQIGSSIAPAIFGVLWDNTGAITALMFLLLLLIIALIFSGLTGLFLRKRRSKE